MIWKSSDGEDNFVFLGMDWKKKNCGSKDKLNVISLFRKVKMKKRRIW